MEASWAISSRKRNVSPTKTASPSRNARTVRRPEGSYVGCLGGASISQCDNVKLTNSGAKPPKNLQAKSRRKTAEAVYGFDTAYRCAHCQMRFHYAVEVHTHHRERHSGLNYLVQLWDAATESYGPSSAEVPEDPRPIIHKCSLCKKSVGLLMDALRHLEIIHGKHCCRNCGRMFHTRGALHIHRGNAHRTYMNEAEPAVSSKKEDMGKSERQNRDHLKKKSSKRKRSNNEDGETCIGERVDSGKVNKSGQSGHVAPNDAGNAKQTTWQLCCNTCQKAFQDSQTAQQHAYDMHGIFMCCFCPWSTFDLKERLKLHHYETHGGLPCMMPKTLMLSKKQEASNIATLTGDVTVPLLELPPVVASTFFCSLCKKTVELRVEHLFEEHHLYGCRYCDHCTSTDLSLHVHHIAEHEALPFPVPNTQRQTQEDTHTLSSSKAKQSRQRRISYNDKAFSTSLSDTSMSEDDGSGSDEPSITSQSESTASGESWDSHESEQNDVASKKSVNLATYTTDEESVASGPKHDESNELHCILCDHSLPSREDLIWHKVRVHNQDFFCCYCSYGSKFERHLERHVCKTHPKCVLKYVAVRNNQLKEVWQGTPLPKDDETSDNAVAGVSWKNSLSIPENSSLTCSPIDPTTLGDNSDWEQMEACSTSLTDTSYYSPLVRDEWISSPDRHTDDGNSIDCSTECSEPRESLDPGMESPVAVKTYGGYRVPKSADAFRSLMEHATNKFKCCGFTCSYSCQSSTELESHLEEQHTASELFCIYCGKRAGSPRELLNHLNNHLLVLKHGCTKCLYCASSKVHLQIHFMHAHPQESFSSLELGKGMDQAMEQSLSASSWPADSKHRAYACGFSSCCFRANEPSALITHLADYHGNESWFPCYQCDQKLDSSIGLVEHLSQKHRLADIRCRHCSTSSASFRGMLLHQCYSHPESPLMLSIPSSSLSQELASSRSFHLAKFFINDNSPEFEADLNLLMYQQHCCFCPHLVAGFDDLLHHVVTEHNLTLTSKDLADRLFSACNYMAGLEVGLCPFCSFATNKQRLLQEHILYRELQCKQASCSSCGFESRSSKALQRHIRKEHDGNSNVKFQRQMDSELLQWVEENIKLKRSLFTCTYCPKSFGEVKPFRLHLQLHQFYYKSNCKLCGNVFRGFQGLNAHLFEGHNLGSPAPRRSTIQAEVEEIIRLQTMGHACKQCGFRTFSRAYSIEHSQRCRDLDAVCAVPKKIRSRAKGKQTYQCLKCDIGFAFLQPLLRHSYKKHQSGLVCMWCYWACDTKEALQHHYKTQHSGIDIYEAFELEEREDPEKQHSVFYVSQISVHCGTDPEGYSFYGNYEPVQGVGKLFLKSDSRKIPLAALMDACDFECYVLVPNSVL